LLINARFTGGRLRNPPIAFIKDLKSGLRSRSSNYLYIKFQKTLIPEVVRAEKLDRELEERNPITADYANN
jgi:hypothetical protein